MHLLNRRTFLARTGAAIALSTAPGLVRTAAAAGFLFPPGIQLYAVRDPLATDPAGTLKALTAIGYREVESAG